MECTQRLDFECSQVERICPDQIGFLGILGTKYPVKRGPNKIGRDPQTCSIVLNKNSISRQHAVINVLNGNNYMLMDLDSANKTRLNNKSLQAYIPVPISNGDTVQFGEVFGIFRLLEEETDLPCTQAVDLPCTQLLDIPDTPAPSKHASRLRHAVIPESPDVSDKDDSFLVPSQPKSDQFKSPSNNFKKLSGKTIATSPIGSNKIDSIFWRSSKKSESFNLDDSGTSLNKSSINGDIHNLETQQPAQKSTDSIYTAETQIPLDNSPSIHNLNTQLPENGTSADKNREYDVFTSKKENTRNIFDAETQFSDERLSDPSIFDANTELPVRSSKEVNKSIFEENTQIPENKTTENNIFEAQTQLPFGKPVSEENRPAEIFEANTQFLFGKQPNSENLFEANTQLPLSDDKPDDLFEADSAVKSKDIHITGKANASTSKHDCNLSDTVQLSNDKIDTSKSTSKDDCSKDPNKSNEEIIFNEFETQNFLDDLQSQPILGTDFVDQPLIEKQDNEEIPLSQSNSITDDDFLVPPNDDTDELSQVRPTKRNQRIESNGSSENTEPLSQVRPTKINVRIESDSSTDCEDLNFLPTQKIPEKPANEEEVTDCEDNSEGTSVAKVSIQSSPKIDFEDLATQVIPEVLSDKPELRSKETSPVIPIPLPKKSVDIPNFQDLPTQVIPEDDVDFEDLPTQVIPEELPLKSAVAEFSQFSEEIISPFKVPLQKAVRTKKKDLTKVNESASPISSPLLKPKSEKENDERYYSATQDIIDDLCSQADNANTIKTNAVKLTTEQTAGEISLGPIGDGSCVAVTKNLPKKKMVRDISSESSEGEDKINKFVSGLSVRQIKDVIGVDVTIPRRTPSDPSDGETTPKKVRPGKFMETDLPDSQEIKTSVSLSSRTIATDSSSDSETEKESQEQTPIVFRKKKRVKADVKIDLTAKFDTHALPTRILTRARKPTTKIQESDIATRKRSENILKPKYLTEYDDIVDSDIITENITRLKNKNDKKIKNEVIDLVTEPPKQVSEKRKNNRSKNNDIVDLTVLGESVSESKKKDVIISSDIPLTSSNENRNNISRISKASKSDTNANIIEINEDKKIQEIEKSKISENDVTKPKPRVTRSRKQSQGKITDYTVTNASKVQVSKVDESLNSVKEVSKGTKRTRNIKKDNESKVHDSKSPVTDENETSKRRRGRPRKEDNLDHKKNESQIETKKEKPSKQQKNVEKPVEEPPVRRSRRQKTVKDNSDSQPKTIRNHEQSTVYNISSESGADSPKGVKRSATLDVEVPSPKRTRSVVSLGSSSNTTSGLSSDLSSKSPSMRATPSRPVQEQRVLFTAFPSEEVKGKLEELGATVVTDVWSCTVVLTLQLRRTFKLLCAVGLGRPIVGPPWVQACVDNNTIVDPWQHLLVDSASEERFKFSLSRTLRGPRGFLRARRVSATPSVLPAPPEMKLIVESSGGVWGEGAGGARGWVVVTCGADRALWGPLRRRGAQLVTVEFILTGVLRQEFDVQPYLIQ